MMSAKTHFDDAFDLRLSGRETDGSLIFRGLMWAIPLGISFWSSVAVFIWMR